MFNVILRTLNEEYLLESWLRYYQELRIHQIFVFDSISTDKTIEVIKNWEVRTDMVKLVESIPQNRFTTFQDQTKFCNRILEWIIKYNEDTPKNCFWFFPDADEFLSFGSFRTLVENHSQSINQFLFRSVFIDWYLTPDQFYSNLNPNQILDLIETKKLRGRISDLWGDPFYKDNVLFLSPQTLPLVKQFRTVGGFHRFILNNKVFIPPNTPFLLINHLRILPKYEMEAKINLRLQMAKFHHDDWSFVHFSHLKSITDNYEEKCSQLNLKSYRELMNDLKDIGSYNNTESYYNNTIMRDNIHYPTGSRPSMYK